MLEKNNKRILLIMSGYAKAGVGEQFVQAMLSGYNHKNIYRYSTITTPVDLKKDIYDYPTIIKQVPYSFLPLLSSIKYRKFQKKHLNSCVKDVLALIKEKKIDKVWLICNSSSNINIGAGLIDKISIPIIAQIWDTPEYFGKTSRLGPNALKDLLSKFKKVMTNAQQGVVISDSMGKIYEEKYGLDPTTMVFSPPLKSFPKSKVMNVFSKKTITIVFAGGLYAYKTWNYFLDAVEKRNKSNFATKIKVRCIGRLSRWDKKRDWVRYDSLKPIEEAVQIVNEADIAYLPYWMDKKHAYTVKTAFPSKLSFYTSAGTPILYHGPKDSTPKMFLNKYLVGKGCDSKEAEDILSTIDDLCSKEFRANYIKEQEKTLNNIFHPDKMVEIFNNIIA